jgi:inhibitor of cysteine peptidase
MRKGFKYLLFMTCVSSLSISYAAPDDANAPQQAPTSTITTNTTTQMNTQATMPPGTFSNPATTIYVRPNAPEFKLRLESNPSTGYSWFLRKCDVNLVNVVRHKFYPSQSQVAGAPGYEEWVFKATPMILSAPHITHVVMVYARPSEAAHSHEHKKFTIISK